MRFGVLGPIAVWDGDEPVRVSGPRERRLLGMLLLYPNVVLPPGRLAAAVWGQDAPATAKAQLHNSVAKLRRVLSTSGTASIASSGSGFTLRVEADRIDAASFARQVAEAEREPDPATAAELLRAALKLWRGPALDGADEGILGAEARHLDEQRLGCLERRIALDLDVGRHADVVGELATLAGEHPEREGLVELRMLALYRAGRRQDALAVYAEARRRLAEETGLDPAPRLSRLQQAMLRSDPALDLPQHVVAPAGRLAVPPVPAQLPADAAVFTGRAGQLRWLDALLDGTGGAPRVAVIDGTAGVGKTALATHWAHRVRDRFPDGQLYVNLRGYSPAAPLAPVEALAQFLRALGVPAEQVPAEVEEAAGLYRTRLADKRLLVVLDNARGPEQVRPLLPGTGACFVVVTSRDRLTGLVAREGAHRISLDVLDPDEVRMLLGRVLGTDRTGAEPGACAELAALCARLPLALRIAAAQLLDRPDESIGSYVAALCRGDRLAALAIDGDESAAVRDAFDVSYAALPAAARRLFRLLGLVPGPDLTVTAAGALADVPARDAERLLTQLVRVHLLDRHAPDRYTFHDLLRHYALGLAQQEETEPDRDCATSRLLDHYLHTADRAAALFYPQRLRLPVTATPGPRTGPHFADATGAAAWLDVELPNLVAAIRYAGPRPAAWLLADTLRGYFALRYALPEWRSAAQAGLAAASAVGDLRGQAAAQISLAELHWRQEQPQRAIERYRRALELARACGWREGEANGLICLAAVHNDVGDLWRAVEHYELSLAINQQTGHLGSSAATHSGLGVTYWQMGRLHQAVEQHRQALALARRIGSRTSEATDRVNLAEALHALGRSDEALAHLVDAVRLHQETGNRVGEAYARGVLAAVHGDAGRYREAIDEARAAGDLARHLGNAAREARALGVLAGIHHRLGDDKQAIEDGERARQLAQATGERFPQVRILVALAVAYQHVGNGESARCYAEDALALARKYGYRMLEDQALAVLRTG
jgi:DNA-binding SARP family transcriptional activator